MHKWRNRILTLIVAAAAIGVLFYVLRRPPVEVTAAPVQRGPVEQTVALSEAGTVTPHRHAKVAAPVTARVAELYVEEGALVKADQPIVRLESADLKNQAATAKAAFETGRSQLAQARLALKNFRDEFARQKRLAEQGVISEAQWRQTQDQLTVLEQQVTTAERQVKQLETAYRIARENVTKTQVRAPFTGTITALNAHVGELPNPAQPLFEIGDLNNLHIEGTVDEIEAPKVKPGMKAHLHSEAFAGKTFEGEVSRIADYVKSTARQARVVPVEIELPADTPFLSGMGVDADIVVDRVEDVAYVPTFAVGEEAGEKYVYVVRDGKAARTAIQTGLVSNEATQVTAGLAPGDQIVTSLDQPVSDGTRIKVVAKVTRKK